MKEASAQKIDVSVSAGAFDFAELYQAIERNARDNQQSASSNTSACEIGAVASFVGKVRQFEPREGTSSQLLMALEIEHYPAMTQKAIVEICEQACLRWPFDRCLVRHRIGRLNIGDDIVLVMVASSHRKEAFEACEFIMDYLKTEAPLWKKAIYSDGAEWIDAKSSDDDRRQRWAGRSTVTV